MSELREIFITKATKNESDRDPYIGKLGKPSNKKGGKIVLIRDQHKHNMKPYMDKFHNIHIIVEHDTYCEAVISIENSFLVKSKKQTNKENKEELANLKAGVERNVEMGEKKQKAEKIKKAVSGIMKGLKKTIREVSFNDLPDYLDDGTWELFSTHVVDDKIVYVIKKVILNG